MIDSEDFKKTVDNKFWNHITKGTLFPYEDKKTKQEVIEDIVKRINSGVYIPSGVRRFIIFNKSRISSNRIARIVPSFHVSDYIFLYYLLKKIEEELSQDIHPNAFGSFRNFKYFRDKEKQNHELLGYDSLPSIASVSSFHKYYWLFEWKEFMGKSRRIFNKKKYSYFIAFDIADFYPSINLLLLERKIRSVVSKDKQIFVDLLFYFLQHSNNKFKRYTPEMKGIPQDEVGDASRILANFFLQSFDHDVNNFASALGGELLRFADDHIIFASDEEKAAQILFYTSIQLQKIGLSINGAKVKDYKNRDEFQTYWSFDLHEMLDKKKEIDAVNEYLKRDKEKFKWQTLLSRFLYSNSRKLDTYAYFSICKELLDDSFVSTLDYGKLLRLYTFLPKSERKKFLEQLDRLIDTNNFNSYHFNLIKAINKNTELKRYFNSKRVRDIETRIEKLEKFFD